MLPSKPIQPADRSTRAGERAQYPYLSTPLFNELVCGYRSKVCRNVRARKRDGTLHRFCEDHRRRANMNQKRWATRRFQSVCHGEQAIACCHRTGPHGLAVKREGRLVPPPPSLRRAAPHFPRAADTQVSVPVDLERSLRQFLDQEKELPQPSEDELDYRLWWETLAFIETMDQRVV